MLLRGTMQDVGNLLNYPKQLNWCEMKPEYFETEELQQIVSALMSVEDTDTLLPLLDKLNEGKDIFETTTIDKLEMLKGCDDSGKPYVYERVPYFKHAHYQGLLNEAWQEYNANKTTAALAKIKEYMGVLETCYMPENESTLEELQERYLTRINEKESKAIRTYDWYDAETGGLKPGDLVVIGARPACGKTLVGVDMSLRVLKRNKDVAVDFFTLEMEQERLLDRFVSSETGIDSKYFNDPSNLTNEQRQEIERVYKRMVSEYKLRVFDSHEGTLNRMIRHIRERAEYGKYVAVIDYVGLVDVEGVGNFESATRLKIQKATRELKLLANELGIAVVVLAQLNRANAQRQDKTPLLTDLKDSGSLEQDATQVLLLHRAEINHPRPDVDPLRDSPKLLMMLEKNRVGRTKKQEMFMNYACMQAIEWDTRAIGKTFDEF